MDARIESLEHKARKYDGVLEKLCEKNNIKVRRTPVSNHCHKCGMPLDGDDFCQKCGTEKKRKSLQVPKKALRQALDHNFTLLKVTFDLWARGGNAECLRSMAIQIKEGSAQDLEVPAAAPSPAPRSIRSTSNSSLVQQSSSVNEKPEVCDNCGNIFMADANYCRKCGSKREAGLSANHLSPSGRSSRSGPTSATPKASRSPLDSQSPPVRFSVPESN